MKGLWKCEWRAVLCAAIGAQLVIMAINNTQEYQGWAAWFVWTGVLWCYGACFKASFECDEEAKQRKIDEWIKGKE
jgi:hypothetical protein